MRLNSLSCVVAVCILGLCPRCQPSSHLSPALNIILLIQFPNPTFHCPLFTPEASGVFLSSRGKSAPISLASSAAHNSISTPRPPVLFIGSQFDGVSVPSLLACRDTFTFTSPLSLRPLLVLLLLSYFITSATLLAQLSCPSLLSKPQLWKNELASLFMPTTSAAAEESHTQTW